MQTQSSISNLLQKMSASRIENRAKHNKIHKISTLSELRQQMRVSGSGKKQLWKGAGYCNRQFGKIEFSGGKTLTPWERERVSIGERSWKVPKNFKGFKNGLESKQFSAFRYSVPIKIQQQINQKYSKIGKTKQNFYSLHQQKSHASHTSLKFHTKDSLFGFKTSNFRSQTNLKRNSNNYL